MGCNSGKASAPLSSKAPQLSASASTAPHTLLTTPAGEHGLKQDLSQGKTCIAPADLARLSMLGGFNGAWSSGAVISDNGPMALTRKSHLFWADGTSAVVHINDTARSIEMGPNMLFDDDRTPLTGKLFDDDCIHWSDGAVWSRVEDAGQAVKTRESAEVSATSQGGAGEISHPVTKVEAFIKLASSPPSVMVQSKLPGGFDRISIDTADLNLAAGGAESSSFKRPPAMPRKDRGLCCC